MSNVIALESVAIEALRLKIMGLRVRAKLTSGDGEDEKETSTLDQSSPSISRLFGADLSISAREIRVGAKFSALLKQKPPLMITLTAGHHDPIRQASLLYPFVTKTASDSYKPLPAMIQVKGIFCDHDCDITRGCLFRSVDNQTAFDAVATFPDETGGIGMLI